MPERAKTADTTNTADKINKQFASNPIASRNDKFSYDSIFEKVLNLQTLSDINLKSEKISEIVNYINQRPEQELLNLFSSESEIIRSLAARAYVDNSSEFSIKKLEFMLKDNKELIRDSAVMALCYINSVEVLGLLNEATKDNSNSIKIKAIAGIADIASENAEAKKMLESFINDTNPEIRQFVSDELSFLN